MSEIDFETVDIYDRNIHQNKDGVMQSMLWEETSVKLGNDFLFGTKDDESEFGINKINYNDNGITAQPLTNEMIQNKYFDEEVIDLLDGKTAIEIGLFKDLINL